MDDDVKEAVETIRRDMLGGGTTLSYRAALVALDTLKKALETATADNAALLKDRLEMCPTCSGDGKHSMLMDGDETVGVVDCTSCMYVRSTPHPGAALLARLQPKHLGAVVLSIMDKRRRCVGGRLDGPEGIGAPLRQYLLTGEKP